MDTATGLSQITTLAESWELHLQAERKSPATIANCTSAVERLTDYLEAQGMPDVTRVTREHLEALIVHLLDTGDTENQRREATVEPNTTGRVLSVRVGRSRQGA